MDPDSTFSIPNDGATDGDLSIIFEGDEEASRNCTLNDDNNSNVSETHSSSTLQTRSFQSQTFLDGNIYEATEEDHHLLRIRPSCSADQAPTIRVNSVSTSTDHGTLSEPGSFSRVEQDAVNSKSGQMSGSDGSVSIHELYENTQAFTADSGSEVDASSDEIFIAQAKLHSEEDYNFCSVASSVYMLGLGSIPVTPVISSTPTPTSKVSHTSSTDKNFPQFSTSSCGVNGGLLGAGDADQVCSQTSNTEECTLQMQNLHVGITAPSDTESMGPMMDGKNVSDSEPFTARARARKNKKRVSFSDCEGEDVTKSRSLSNGRTSFGVSPATRYRYKLPRFIADTDECKSSMYFPSPLSTFKRKSLISSYKPKGECRLETVDIDLTAKNSDEKDSDSAKSCPSKWENQDPIALSFSDEGTPIFRKNQELKGLASLSPKTLKSKKLETKMQSQMRGALFDYESKWASEDVKFRRKVKSLELEYENKFLGIVQNHNALQEKLYEKLLGRIHKIEKRVKKEALQGRLKEGNCFQISHDIGNIKLGD